VQRYFLPPSQIHEEEVIFTGDELHHITKVMRFSAGDQVIACDGLGKDVIVEFSSLSGKEARGKIIKVLEENRELPVEITLAQGLPKGDKMDLIVQKATEMGVVRIIPFISSRTIVKLDDKKEAIRLARWQKIAKEAAEQSHRSRIPEISEVIHFNDLVTRFGEFDQSLLAYELSHENNFKDLIAGLGKGAKVLIIIGPEGGFAESEAELAGRHGIHSLSLGRRILRTETAGIVALSFFVYHFELAGN
jgi:16S rRNA (uracil1498-N3)-methyltransferase